MDDWRKEREQRRLELAAELRGDMSKEEEDELHARLREKEMLSESLKSKSEERSTKGEVLEQAFNEIRQATGVNTLDQMVQKFMGQGANKSALIEEREVAERRLAEVVAEKETVQVCCIAHFYISVHMSVHVSVHMSKHISV
jgi:S-adenosylmethionine/arginine decarboxylase-like enzyme